MAAEKGLVSIHMPCCGQLEYTRLSVPRVLRHSRQPFELLFIDGGSLDGTAEYLEGVVAASPAPAELMRDDEDMGFPRLVEVAMAKARGEFVAWVNNDVLVPDLWLNQLVALVTAHEKIAAVGPVANLAGERQRLTDVPYRLGRALGKGGSGRGNSLDTQEVDRFARQVRETKKSQWGQIDRVEGFCWLARRAAFPALEFALESGEDNRMDTGTFSIRARQAGVHLACCRDLYVHHFGSRIAAG